MIHDSGRTRPGVIHQLLSIDDGHDHDLILDEVVIPTPEGCRRALEEVPLDLASFQAEFATSRPQAIDHLAALYHHCADRGWRTAGTVGLILFTLRLVEYFDTCRGGGGPVDPRVRERALRSARELITQRPVREAMHAVYAPGLDRYPSGPASDVDPAAQQLVDRQAAWDAIEIEDTELHQLGTTSFILRTTARSALPNARRNELAVKCVLLPYSRIHAIAAATESYRAVFGGVPHRPIQELADHLPVVYASTQVWVIMDFIPGQTLAEILRDAGIGHRVAPPSRPRQRRPAIPPLRLDLLASYGPLVFDALANIQQLGLAHLDLAPSNIIIEPAPSGSARRAVLVDFGRNHLYSRSIGAMEGPEGSYIAPEVKEAVPDDTMSADLYSLGKLLIALGGVNPAQTTLVPDQFYLRTPALARFIEDLVDERPARRLVCYGGPRWTYSTLGREFMRELDALREAEREKLPDPGRDDYLTMLDVLRPSARSPSRQLRLWRARRAQLRRTNGSDGAASADLRAVRINAGAARRHLLWSAVCSACWAIFIVVMSAQILRDLGVDPAPLFVDLGQRLAEEIGLAAEAAKLVARIDELLGEPGPENLGARLVGASFALVNVRHYQNIYAGVTPLLGWSSLRPSEKLHALATEALIRLFAFWWLILVLGAQFGRPLTWPLWVTTGLAGTFLLNWTVKAFANGAVAKAQQAELSTIPPQSQPITGLAMFSRWTPSMFAYLIIVGPTAWLIYRGVLQDELMYATMLLVANLGIFYFVKCTMDAPAIRVGLARAFLASERVALIGGRRRAVTVAAPRASDRDHALASAGE